MLEILSRPIPLIGVSTIQIIYAVVVLIVGYILIRITVKMLESSLRRLRVPEIVNRLMINLTKALGWLIIIIAAASALGINTGSVILGLSAVIGLIIGFGMNDTIANMAAGIWLAIYRPFNIGDAVNVNGQAGIVKNISIMAVELATFDGLYVFMPSKTVWGATIVNYSRNRNRRVDVKIGVAYGADLDKAVKIALDTVKKHPDILDDPEPQVLITELADSSINLEVKAWTTADKFLKVKSELTRLLLEKFTENNIEIPFPQIDVHIRDGKI